MAMCVVGAVIFGLIAGVLHVARGDSESFGLEAVVGVLVAFVVGRMTAGRLAVRVERGEGAVGPLLALAMLVVGGVAAGITRLGVTDDLASIEEPLRELIFEPLLTMLIVGAGPALLVGVVFTAVLRLQARRDQ
ncbi:MAG: hypothetical protein CMJ83_03555 [Planctomycetes bacterium]|nr:hypothetical protein [Planctomycetota bacterium]